MSEKKKSGVFKGFLSNFVEFSEENQKKDQPIETNPQTTVSSPAVSHTPVNSGAGMIDKVFIDHFEEMLDKMDIPGPDYMEFSKALENLKDSGLSEPMLYQTAWKAGFKAMGVNDPNILINTANKYIEALNSDKDAFLGEIQKKIDTEVGGLNKRLEELDANNLEAEAEIKRLQALMDANNKEKGEIYKQISEKSSKLSTRKENYVATHSGVVNMIQDHVNKIKTYIIQQ